MTLVIIHTWLTKYVTLDLPVDICLVPPFAIDHNGYINFRLDGHYYKAHRFVCTKFHGKAPFGFEAAHSCGNASCVNPHHLSWKTHAQNMRDTVYHNTVKSGESHHASKLTDDIVRSIRKDARGTKQIADHYAVNVKTVYSIRNNKSWRHVI